jgi:ATP-dependent Clp protease, protease subunit
MTIHVHARGYGVAEVRIYDEIASHGGVSAASFDDQLKALGRIQRLVLRINSPGGEVPQAAAIYNMLERLKASGTHIAVVIDGVAASAASWIAMVGDEVIMPENTMMMIHNPAGLVVGESADMRDVAVVLDKVRDNMVAAYASKSRKSATDVRAIMDAETWYTAAEAVAAGFADRVEQPIRIAAAFDPARFARHVPKTMDALVAQFWRAHGVTPPIARSPRAAPSSAIRDEVRKRMTGSD